MAEAFVAQFTALGFRVFLVGEIHPVPAQDENDLGNGASESSLVKGEKAMLGRVKHAAFRPLRRESR